MPTDVLLLGTGVVGSAFLEIARDKVDIFGVANSRGFATPDHVGELCARPKTERPARLDDVILDRLAERRGVLVDATADGDIGETYERALARGIDVVTANKKPLAGPLREALRSPRLRYEATVGAALPVLHTLDTLVRTGDRVKRIDCVLSGTLAFVCNALAEGTPLSRAVAIARERGYTEPDPREDLRGTDVARKAVILARALGGTLELDDVDLEPIVPDGVDLATLDGAFANRAERLLRRREKLVYLAQIETTDTGVKASAGPVVVPLGHPAAQLEGASALVAFTTARHGSEPLVIRGSGAGGPVTASALLADIFACQRPCASPTS